MSRTREEKLAEDLHEDTRRDIEAQYDRIDAVEDLEPNDIIVIETHNGVTFAGEVVNVHDKDQYTVDFETLAYDGPEWQEDGAGSIVISSAGADGSIEPWDGVPYTTTIPSDINKDTWGDIETMDVLDDADEAIREVLQDE